MICFQLLVIKLRNLPGKNEEKNRKTNCKSLSLEVEKWRVMRGCIRWVLLFMLKCSHQNCNVLSWLEKMMNKHISIMHIDHSKAHTAN